MPAWRLTCPGRASRTFGSRARPCGSDSSIVTASSAIPASHNDARPVAEHGDVARVRPRSLRGLLALTALAALSLAAGGCAKEPAATAESRTLRFAALGDHGTGGTAQREVADQLARVHADRALDFVLLLGDSFYPNGVAGVG